MTKTDMDIKGEFIMDTHNEPAKTYTVVDTLEEMRKLTSKKGWNSYDAEPVPGEVIDNAIALVKTLRYMPEVYPVATGNVQMEWDRSDGGYLEVTVLEDPDEVKVYLDIPKQNYNRYMRVPTSCVRRISTDFKNGRMADGCEAIPD